VLSIQFLLHYVTQKPLDHLCSRFENKIQPTEGGAIGGTIGGIMGGIMSELTDRQLKVLKLVENNPNTSISVIAKELNINRSAAKAHFDALKEKGIITRIGGTRGYWKIIYQK
jgi:ATP-dependent DNA helicase RecG